MEQTCSWCNKPEHKLLAHEGKHICLHCLLRLFPSMYQFIYGNRTVEEVQHEKPIQEKG